ncbi:MAG: hypothetical protein H7A45_11245 [Verrucomicrobiales bacterium]|nr:hypothetical protein [Verrucomicrobiales bacterium]MCP5526061.1 hypothetical protein [Verrucomicrobiales bacterium]
MKRIACTILLALGVLNLAGVADDAKCPVSGKPVDASVTRNVNGKTVAFCCENCPGALEKKLNTTDAGCDKCPISGKTADPKTRMLHSVTEAVYLCCAKCEKKYRETHKVAALKETTPGKCPVSGEPASADTFVVENGQKVYFCCNKCAGKYKQAHHVVMVDKGPGKCPISGEPADKERVVYQTKTQAVYFCCENCAAKYVKNEIEPKL